jgi:anti-sigma regulatory factor (Ser/Thr protein kinase)
VRIFAVEVDVPGGPTAGRHARRLVNRELTGRVPDYLVGDVALLVTELVVNGVRHGGAGPGSAMRVAIEGRPPGLHVEVANPHPHPGQVELRRPDLEGQGGLGLHIVERMASRWGVSNSAGTVVWFELDC